MSISMKILNLRYFAGIESLNSKDLISSEGLRLYWDSSEGFLKSYTKSIFSDKDTDDNNFNMRIKK